MCFFVISVFLWRFVRRFWFREKYGDLNQNLRNLFHKMNHPIPYNIYMGWKRPLESILDHFLTHICEKGPKKLIFRNFLPGELIFQTELGPPLIVQTTQIIPLFIALCMYFEGKVTKICRKSPKFLKIWLLKTGIRLAIGRFLRVLEPHYDLIW